MLAIDPEDNTIYITRGDVPVFSKIAFCLPIYNDETGEEELYQFKLTDKISFIVKEKKGYTKDEVFRIDKTLAEMGYTEPTYYPEIPLTEEMTKKFILSNKKTVYWYDVVLNDTATIIGFDEDGAKKIIVYPEGGEINE